MKNVRPASRILVTAYLLASCLASSCGPANVAQHYKRFRTICTAEDSDALGEFVSQHGADYQVTVSGEDTQPLICVAAETGAVWAVQALLDHGADVEACASNGSSALDAAIGCRDFAKFEAICETLVRAGADLEHRSDSGETAFLTLVRRGNVERSRFLLDLGSNPCAKNAKGKGAKEIAESIVTTDGPDMRRAVTEWASKCN